jgi:hypothetical protein
LIRRGCQARLGHKDHWQGRALGCPYGESRNGDRASTVSDTMKLHMSPARRADLLTRVVDDEVVILDRERQQVHCLNVTAACIWNQCDGLTAPDAIAGRLAAQFGREPHDVAADVARTLNEFRGLGLLES